MKMYPATSFVAERPIVGSTLAHLSHALSHPETWPTGFEFDYVFYDTCARGLAHRLGMIEELTSEAVMKAFGISAREAYRLFDAGYAAAYLGKVKVTAAMVADRIDAHLGAKSIG